MFDRPGRAADRFPSPFPNENAAAAANGGKAPPDLSLMAKARTYERGFPWFVFDIFTQFAETGPDYVTAVLDGYKEPPAGFTVPEGGHYNEYFPGHIIAMPKPLSDGQVEYPKLESGQPQVPETVGQYARDVTAFLMWTAEPHLEARKRLGLQAILFLILLSGLLYFTKKKIWARGRASDSGTAPASDLPLAASRQRPLTGPFLFALASRKANGAGCSAHPFDATSSLPSLRRRLRPQMAGPIA